ncbi:hypothetical protein ES703_35260 [subsurface metagenome]
MAKDGFKKCWYCGSKDMEDKGSYARCLSCGATFSEIRMLGPSCLTIDNDPHSKHYSYTKDSHSRPGSSTTRRAAKARGDG